MKKQKIKVLVLVLACVILFTGCPNSNAHIDELFAGGVEIKPDKSSTTWKYVVLEDLDDVQVRLEANGDVGSYNVTYEIKDKYDNGKGSYVNGCSNRDSNTIQKIDLNTLTADRLYNFKIKLYSESNCSGSYLESVPFDIYTYVPTSDDDDISQDQDDLVQLIGGEDLYCNREQGSNVKKFSNSSVKAVQVAFSQIGYAEKSSSSDVYQCKGAYSGNYTRYASGNSAWCDAFVMWALQTAGADIPSDMPKRGSADMVSWAKKSSVNRWTTSTNDLHDGDLVKYSSSSTGNHIGMLYKENGKWKVIHGNWGGEVAISSDIDLNKKNTDGFIKMNGIAY